MSDKSNLLKSKLQELANQWQKAGLPGRQTLMDTAQDLNVWKQSNDISGLWPDPPVFLTATLDDAWGHGLELIEAYAKVLGLAVFHFGLEKTAEEIIDACKANLPDFLGMTVLQFDSEEDLCDIGKNIPEKTKMIVGGPIFKSDPEIAQRAGIHFVAKNVTDFIHYFLSSGQPHP